MGLLINPKRIRFRSLQLSNWHKITKIVRSVNKKSLNKEALILTKLRLNFILNSEPQFMRQKNTRTNMKFIFMC